MNSLQYLLHPVNPGFIAFSFVLAFLFNLTPWGHVQWIPDLVALMLVLWNIRQPRRVGMVMAFLLGLLMDAHEARLLGECTMTYTILSYFAIAIHWHVLRFTMLSQALHVLPLLVLARAVPAVIRLLMGAHLPGWQIILSPLIEAALWPFTNALLLAPQRRPKSVDETRPI